MRTATHIFIRTPAAWCVWVCVILLALCGQARALMPASSPCVELQASRADCVVTGIIEKREAMPGPPSTRYPSAWTRLTVRTAARLLDDPGDEFICVIPNDSYSYATPAKVGEEALFILAKGSRYAITYKGLPDPWFKDIPWTTLADVDRDPYGMHAPPMSLDSAQIRFIVTMRLEAFTNRQDVIDQVSKYCARPMPLLKAEGVWNPDPDRYSTATKLPWTLVIGLPEDANADALARIWIDSPNDILRDNAVRILRHTHSVLNVEALTRMARKPARTSEQDVARSMALSTLATWGEPVEWMRNHDTVKPNGPTTFNFWLCAALVPVASVIYWIWFGRTKGWRQIVVSMWLFGLSLLLIVTARSLTIMDGYECGHWKGGAVRGDMYVVWMLRRDTPNLPPFLWENPRNMPELMNPEDYYDRGWNWELRNFFHPFIKPFGIESFGQDIYPTWEGGITYRLPLWLAILAWLLPLPLYYLYLLLRRWRTRPRRGFPVVVNDSPS